MMPLPDADKKSPRVYTNLQNLDLDSLTFANIQATGNPIAVEEMNEDEMRRLVLVNLARLVTAGEWTGLLSAGGGGGVGAAAPTISGTTNTMYNVGQCIVWGANDDSHTVATASMDKPFAFPFIAPESGDVSELGIQVTTLSAGDSVYVAIYDSDEVTNQPDTRLGYALISINATGSIYQTSITGTITLEANKQYWYSISTDQAAAGYLMGIDQDFIPSMGLASNPQSNTSAVKDNATTSYAVPPASFTTSFGYSNFTRPLLTLKVA